MKAIVSIALGLTLVAACAKSPTPVAAPEAEQSFRATRPEPGPMEAFRAPTPERLELANGMTVLVAQKSDLPLVHVQVVVRAGSAADPDNAPGTAAFLAEMLRSGTKSKSAQQIADEVEQYGASLNVSVDDDATTLSLTVLRENLEPVLDVLADVLQNPALKADEIERVRKRRLASLAELRAHPGHTASVLLDKAIYGDLPYGHSVLGTEAAISAMSQQTLRQFYHANYGPKNAAIIVAGAVSPSEAQALLAPRFESFKGKADAASIPPAPPTRQPVLWLVDKPDAPQSQLRIGHLGVARDNPDYYPLVLMNAVLGGLFNSRINMNLREDKGYTYGAGSTFDFRRGEGPFLVYTAVRTDVTQEAIGEVLAEIERMRATNVSEEELAEAKSSYIAALPGYFETVDTVASMVSNIYLYNLPLDYYRKLGKELEAITVADVRRVAEQHLHPNLLSIVVVGDQEQVRPGLSALGRGDVVLRDERGEPVGGKAAN